MEQDSESGMGIDLEGERTALLAQLRALSVRLDDPALRPDASRTDWATAETTLAETTRELAELETTLRTLEPLLVRDEYLAIRGAVAQYAAELAVILQLAGDRKGAHLMHQRAASLAPDGAIRDEVRAAADHPETFAQVAHARFMSRHGDPRGARDLVAKLRTDDPTLKRSIADLRDAPEPVTSAPGLGTLNGVGFGMYGSRDEAADGTYVATHCFCFLFIPIFPFSAYRVHREGNRYAFYAKVPLSGFARNWRRALGLGIVLAIAVAIGSSWWNEPSRQLAREVDAVDARTSEDTAARAIEYERLLGEYEYSAPGAVDGLRASLMNVLVAGVAEPMTAARAPEVDRLVARGRANDVRAGSAAAEVLATAAERWAGQIDGDDLEAAEARARILAVRPTLLQGDALFRARDAAQSAEIAVAEALRDEWPVAAFSRLVALGTPDAIERADALVPTFTESVLLLELRPQLATWGGASQDAEARAALEARLGHAHAVDADEARAAALAQPERATLEAQLARFPEDAAILATLADTHRGSGDPDAAVDAFGASAARPGALASVAQIALAHALREAGRTTDADALLSRLIADRMPPYLEAARAYEEQVSSIVDALDRDAQMGRFPPGLDAQIRGATSDDEARALYSQWVGQRIDEDPSLAALREAASRLADVVPLSIELAMVKLMRADEAEGAARDALLKDAEEVFLSVRQQAEGSPDYHLGLGQVYHRLGRPDEGDAEFAPMLSEGPEMRLAVARIYRGLGLRQQASSLAEDVWSSGAEEATKGQAAVLMSLLVTDPEAEEMWLRRAPQDLTFVQNGLSTLAARQAVEEGRYDEAGRLFAEVASRFEAEMARDPSASTNAAIAHLERYSLTGDPRTLQSATRLLEDAVRRAPESELTVLNLASARTTAGRIAVLGRWIRPEALLLDSSNAEDALAVLKEGPLRSAVQAAVASDPSLQRASDLYSQSMVLAPNQAEGFAGSLDAAIDSENDARILQIAQSVSRNSYEDAAVGAMREAYRSREDPEGDTRRMESAIRLRHDAVERSARHAPTEAVGRCLLGRALLARGVDERDVVHVDAAIAELRRAQTLWSELDVRPQLGWMLVIRGVLARAQTDAAVRAALDAGDRRSSMDQTLASLAPEAARPVAGEPSVVEGMNMLRVWSSEHGGRPDVSLWTLAVALNDEALAALHRGVFENPAIVGAASARARLRPWDESAAQRAERLASGPQ